VIVPAGHARAAVKPLTFKALASWPIITYPESVTRRARIDQAFAHAELEPEIAMSAVDADVIKTYVELGLGVGILASMVYEPARDSALALLAGDIFGENTARIGIRRGRYLRAFACRFLELCAPALTEATVRASVMAGKDIAQPG
jgi:LysR family cys regulon transcriptional activator